MKTLVLGGYGNFGARICRALAGHPHTELLVCGRSAQQAQAFAHTLGHGAQGVALDLHAGDFAAQLKRLGVQLLIHTAGPFQAQAYAVAQAAAQAGAHYIDLADGRRFVCDFAAAMDASFQQAQRSAITGASTVPALSAAVVQHLCAGWQRVDTVDTCIAPAQTAPRGEATLAAVLSYCGEPLRVWVGGQWTQQRGWAAPQRITFARMRPRLGALCDIPDLELFPAHFAVTERVMFRAALEVGLAQRTFAALATLRRWGLLPHPEKLARLLHRTGTLLDPFGTDLGGMVVRVQGLDAQGLRAARAWHITAPDDHGPEIPCMAAILLARKLAEGHALPVLPIGARPCMGLLALQDFAPEFARWGMQTEMMEEQTPSEPLA